MRKVKISPTLNDGGYTTRAFSQWEVRSAPLISWTQFYHKPYCLDDWGQAKIKAKQRKMQLSIGDA